MFQLIASLQLLKTCSLWLSQLCNKLSERVFAFRMSVINRASLFLRFAMLRNGETDSLWPSQLCDKGSERVFTKTS